MAKINIDVYTNLNNVEKSESFLAIKNNDVIKYIDFENNKMIVDMKNNIIIRENRDYLYTMNFNENIITIYIKKLKKSLYKNIKVLSMEYTNKRYFVKYFLSDEKIINEYYVNY